jgi:predicted  nucleic acid-binding Zn-ribbon protein
MKKSKHGEPAAETVSPRDQVVQDKLETLKKDYKDLDTRKITTEANIKNLEEELQRLREQAQKNYGTSDLEELEHLLEERRQENERLVAEYEGHIQDIKDRLEEIDRQPTQETHES